MSSTIPLIVDTDIGTDVDDLVAVIAAATDPRLDLRAVTTVNGDTELRARIVRYFLDLIGRDDVPVGVGARIGLSGVVHSGMPSGFGCEGEGLDLPGALEFPSAQELVHDVLESADQRISICAIGAYTNIASALLARPELVGRVDTIHAMGGCLGDIRVAGSLIARRSFTEHNVSGDPLASALLFALPVRIRLSPLDVTAAIRPTPADRSAIRSAGVVGSLVDDQMTRFLDNYRVRLRAAGKQPDAAAISLHDALVVAGVSDPDLQVLEDRRLLLSGGIGRVRTIEHPLGRSVDVVRKADPRAVCAYAVRMIRAADRDGLLAMPEHTGASKLSSANTSRPQETGAAHFARAGHRVSGDHRVR